MANGAVRKKEKAEELTRQYLSLGGFVCSCPVLGSVLSSTDLIQLMVFLTNELHQ